MSNEQMKDTLSLDIPWTETEQGWQAVIGDHVLVVWQQAVITLSIDVAWLICNTNGQLLKNGRVSVKTIQSTVSPISPVDKAKAECEAAYFENFYIDKVIKEVLFDG